MKRDSLVTALAVGTGSLLIGICIGALAVWYWACVPIIR
jgi:hypothetical protein